MSAPDIEAILSGIATLARAIGSPVRLMEVCGTHTVAIFRHGLRALLPESIQLLSGPGCPVCVTAAADVELARQLARAGTVTLATFGDMMRVPGRRESLAEARAAGADVRIVYSPLDALALARKEPSREVVFFATGFETTSPLVAGTLAEAERLGVANFSIFSVHKTVPPALAALLGSGEVRVDGFILPGHVCTVTGIAPYAFLPARFGKAAVATGFDAGDILAGIAMLLAQLAARRPAVEIQYTRIVRPEGNPRAREVLERFFEPCDAHWRGIGTIPDSGLALRPAFTHRDAVRRFGLERLDVPDPAACQCGAVLKGIKTPPDCQLFGKACTPERPVGACMVSSEGSCAAYYKYQEPAPDPAGGA
ncbi:MAG TPA: hydrogenase formation protein HypD [Candidatus Methanoperedens sp.]|nr:hydrogenase formation protein HypD [Candidatus Methanoperedens sp.]